MGKLVCFPISSTSFTKAGSPSHCKVLCEKPCRLIKVITASRRRFKLSLCDPFLCCHQAARKTCQAFNPRQDGCWLLILRLSNVSIVKLKIRSFGRSSLLSMLRSSSFSFLTDHTPRLEWNVGHVVKLSFLFGRLSGLPKILGMKALTLRLSPCICNLFSFQAQDQSLVPNHLPKLLRRRDGNENTKCLSKKLLAQ